MFRNILLDNIFQSELYSKFLCIQKKLGLCHEKIYETLHTMS